MSISLTKGKNSFSSLTLGLFQLLAVIHVTFPSTAKQECLNSSGVEYTGSLSEAAGGLPCQRWDSQTPNPHNYTNPNLFPDASLNDSVNYCRNPSNDSNGPWCYIDLTTASSDGQTWAHCDIDTCAGELECIQYKCKM